jgi:methyl-accepting chemotaxis protein
MLGKLTTQQDIESVAAQLAELTQSVTEMARQLAAVRAGAEKQQERADTQQERIDLAAKELAEVSERLQAAANALRESI